MIAGSDSAYRILMGLLEARTGQTLSPNRVWRIEMSLKPVMQKHGIADIDALVAALVTRDNRALLDDVIDAMLNNETFFFREHALFRDIAANALDHVRTANAANRTLTIWFCGVATGQEAYSLAMMLAEDRLRWAGWTIELVGTDVSRRAVARARAGAYTQFEIQRGLPVQQMVRWFDQGDTGWTVKADLRTRVEFHVQNMLVDRPPLRRPADLILCRNLLLYFAAPMRTKAFARMRTMLAAGETVLGQTDQFVASQRMRGAYEAADMLQLQRALSA
jgi:chemotaxis protein methyltransferase CheR